MVCDKQHMKDGWKEAGREAEAEARDRESETRTPHKVVGNKGVNLEATEGHPPVIKRGNERDLFIHEYSELFKIDRFRLLTA